MRESRITQRQLMALAFTGVLSAGIRLLPAGPVQIAGRAAWLTPICAILPMALFTWFLTVFLSKRQEDEGLAELIDRCLGRTGGRIVSILLAGWLIFYVGFTLRIAAERLLSAVYQNGSILVFGGVTLLASAVAARGRIQSLVRMAETFFPIICVIVIVVLAFAAVDLKAENVLPVTYMDTGKIMMATVPVADIVSLYGYGAFLLGYVKKGEERRGRLYGWIGWILLLSLGIVLTTVGTMSAELVQHIRNPFFVMIRNLSFFGVIEHIEAVVIVLWVVMDFIILAALLMIISELVGSAAKMKRSHRFVWPAAVGAMAVCLWLAPDQFAMEKFSEVIVPAIQMGIMFVVLPIIYIVGKIRKTI